MMEVFSTEIQSELKFFFISTDLILRALQNFMSKNMILNLKNNLLSRKSVLNANFVVATKQLVYWRFRHLLN